MWATETGGKCGEIEKLEELAPVISCESDFIQRECESAATESDLRLLEAGSIWSFLVTSDNQKCYVNYGKDSNENTVSILWMLPQYVIMTIGEV